MQESTRSFDDMPGLVGSELGVSRWVTVDQKMIDGFADVTLDHQWIHIDAERARKESPHGTTIAHGYLSLSLISYLSQEIGTRPADAAMAINYGLDRVRFLSPVKVGSRVRLRCKLAGFEERGAGQYLTRMNSTIEIEGEEKPALIADNLVLVIKGS